MCKVSSTIALQFTWYLNNQIKLIETGSHMNTTTSSSYTLYNVNYTDNSSTVKCSVAGSSLMVNSSVVYLTGKSLLTITVSIAHTHTRTHAHTHTHTHTPTYLPYKAEKPCLSVHLHFGMLVTQQSLHGLKWDLLKMKAVSLRITEFSFTSLQNSLLSNKSA